MSSDTLYRKRGRRYHAVGWHDPAIWEALPEGSHLLVVQPGGKSVRLRIDPAHAAVLAAIQTHREALLSAMHEAMEARPALAPLTPRQKAAWEALSEALGRPAILEYGAISTALDAMEAAILRTPQSPPDLPESRNEIT